MPPVGLLAIVALGVVLAYALPQRIREREDYAMVRTEDRYSADMRVIRSSAQRVERALARPSTDGQGTPLLTTGAARAKLAALGEGVMSRPAAPLDRAAAVARRQAIAMRRDRSAVMRRRRAAARRRAFVATLLLLGALTAWGFVMFAQAAAWMAVTATSALLTVTVAGHRAVRAQERADARLVPMAREVVTAAEGAAALRRVAAERAAGRPVAPTIFETQAIQVLTSREAAPVAAPQQAAPSEQTARRSDPAAGKRAAASALPSPEGWTPGQVPAPAYTLKASAPRRQARPITDADLDAGREVAERLAAERHPATETLDQILARRRETA